MNRKVMAVAVLSLLALLAAAVPAQVPRTVLSEIASATW
jgi:hypothetical protein